MSYKICQRLNKLENASKLIQPSSILWLKSLEDYLLPMHSSEEKMKGIAECDANLIKLRANGARDGDTPIWLWETLRKAYE